MTRSTDPVARGERARRHPDRSALEVVHGRTPRIISAHAPDTIHASPNWYPSCSRD